MSEHIDLAVIGGSGLYEFQGLEAVHREQKETPFGLPSAPIVVGTLEGRTVAFLARHGPGHRLDPSEVPYRANIFALKALGVRRIVSVSACGSLRQELEPGDFVIPDQLYDHTRGRARSFFGDGVVAHLSAPQPLCAELSEIVLSAARTAGAAAHAGGTHITIEGPRFSTKAESEIYRSWGMSLIGMTAVPEAFLAREAEMCYAVLAHVTDYDVWHESAEPVSVDVVVKRLHQNAALAERTIREVLRRLPEERGCDCPDALAGAIITEPSQVSSEVKQKLGPLIAKYL